MAPVKPSQDIIDDFWKTFITPSVPPSKASAILPRNVYTELIQEQLPRTSITSAEPVDASYQAARSACESKVARIVSECLQINQKYTDPYFNLEDYDGCLKPLTVPKESPTPPAPTQGFDVMQGADRTGHLIIFGDEGGDNTDEKARESLPKSVKRVGDIFDKPQFFVDGADAKDIRQGSEGDCWFLSALAALCNVDASHKDEDPKDSSGDESPTFQSLIHRVCVARDESVGVYGFCIYRDGEWISVIVDDKLYLRSEDYEDSDEQNRAAWENNRVRINSAEDYRREFQSNSRALFYAQSTDPNETWVPLLEKAFAKAHGDYASIAMGHVSEGVEDVTGGVSDMITSSDILSKEKFWNEALMKVNKEFLFGCGTPAWDDPYSMGRDGIQGGHAYSVLRAVEYKGERLVLLKNPWGQSEWNGPWSDGSKEWTSESIRDLGHTFGDDGIFWIPYTTLLQKYTTIYRTRLFASNWTIAQKWTTLPVPWAGESQELKFRISISSPGAPTVIVLSQLDDRYFRGLQGQYLFRLAFRVHRCLPPVTNDDGTVGEGEKVEERYIMRTFGEGYGQRSVHASLHLEEGRYEVRMMISGWRDEGALKVEDVVRANWLERREKLIRVGLAYDLAHAKTAADAASRVGDGEGDKKGKGKEIAGKTTKTTKTTIVTKTSTTTTSLLTRERLEALEKSGGVSAGGGFADSTPPPRDKSIQTTGNAPPPHVAIATGAQPAGGEPPAEAQQPGQPGDNISVTVSDPTMPDGAAADGGNTPSDETGGVKAANATDTSGGDGDADEETNKKIWSAVAVVGLRVYCQGAEAGVEIVRPERLVVRGSLDVDDPAKGEVKREGT